MESLPVLFGCYTKTDRDRSTNDRLKNSFVKLYQHFLGQSDLPELMQVKSCFTFLNDGSNPTPTEACLINAPNRQWKSVQFWFSWDKLFCLVKPQIQNEQLIQAKGLGYLRLILPLYTSTILSLCTLPCLVHQDFLHVVSAARGMLIVTLAQDGLTLIFIQCHSHCQAYKFWFQERNTPPPPPQ